MDKKDIVLRVSNLNVSLDGHKILEDISFELERDDTLAIIGPNGAGKTVLFKCLLGLLPYEGEVNWAPDTPVGYVPQKLYVANDMPLTVQEFLSFKEKRKERIARVLERVGFKENGLDPKHKGKSLLDTRLGVLSGGEFQRVLIAFALLGDPKVLLFDEPTSGVDVSAEETIYSLISKLQKEKDLTIIFISHELQIVYKYAGNVLCLNKEKFCWGPPREAIDKEAIEKLYGEEVHFHKHEETHRHDH